MYLHRCVCDVLEEMRESYKTHNFSYMLGLIEEVQSMANKMEAKINTIHDWGNYIQIVRDLYEDIEKLRGKKYKLEKENI